MEYVVGWDGGGTKTLMKVLDLNGNLIFSATAGSLNYNSNPKKVIQDTIESLIKELHNNTDSLADCKGICISAAGISNKEAVDFITTNLVNKGLQCKMDIIGDHEAALIGAFGKEEGIILISGTGSICFGKNTNGESHRTGGYGHLIDDEGSGYAIGRDILSAAVRIYDKRITDSKLLDLVLDKLGVHRIEEIIQYTYQPNWNKANIASLAPLLIKALEIDDFYAEVICQKASDELVKLVLPVVETLGLENGNIALLGGVLTNYEMIKNKVVTALSNRLPSLHIVSPVSDSATGAALYARNKYTGGL